MRDTEREAETQAEREAGSRQRGRCRTCVGLDPQSPGSGLEPNADAQLLSHPGVPRIMFLYRQSKQILPL